MFTIAAMIASFHFLALALKVIPIDASYGVRRDSRDRNDPAAVAARRPACR
jgi:hypothetical protein